MKINLLFIAISFFVTCNHNNTNNLQKSDIKKSDIKCSTITKSISTKDIDIKLEKISYNDSVKRYNISIYNNSNDSIIFLEPKLNEKEFIGIYCFEYRTDYGFSSIIHNNSKILEPLHTQKLLDTNSVCISPKGFYQFHTNINERNLNLKLENKMIRFKFNFASLEFLNCIPNNHVNVVMNNIYFSNEIPW